MCIDKQDTTNGHAIDACLQLGDLLVAPNATHRSPLQSFYSRQAAALQLRQQEKGKQFLRLAIALVASLGIKGAAAVVTTLFARQGCPQARVTMPEHIEELLPDTEFRAKSQFRSTVSERQTTPGQHRHCEPRRTSRPRRSAGREHIPDVLAKTCPDEDDLVSLIHALCRVNKEGGHVKIVATACWPWVITLLEWLFGPPLDVVAGKQRFRCRIHVIQAEPTLETSQGAIPSSRKNLRVSYRKLAAGESASRKARSRRTIGAGEGSPTTHLRDGKSSTKRDNRCEPGQL